MGRRTHAHIWHLPMRRALILILLLAIVGGIGWWLWNWERTRAPAADPWSALPTNTALVLEMQAPVSTWQRATGTAQIWSAWEKLPGFASFNTVMARLQGLADADVALARAFDASTLLVALVPRGEETGALWIWSIRTDGALLGRLGAALGGPVEQVMTPGGDRVHLQPDKALPPILLEARDGLLLFTSDGPLLEELGAARAAKAAVPDSALVRLRATLGAGTDAHLLLHTGRARRLLNTWCTEEPLAHMAGIEGWMAMDVRFRPEALLMSGLCLVDGAPPALRTLER